MLMSISSTSTFNDFKKSDFTLAQLWLPPPLQLSSSEEVSDHTKAKKLSRFDIGSILYANLQSKLRSLTK